MQQQTHRHGRISGQRVLVRCAQIGPSGTDGLPSDECGSLGTLSFEGKVWNAVPIPRGVGNKLLPTTHPPAFTHVVWIPVSVVI